MCSILKKYGFHAGITLLLLTVCSILPSAVFAECKELEIVEYEDRVEAVCVGEPLTAAQKKALADEERRQEMEYKRQKADEDRRQRQLDSSTAKSKAQADAEQRKKEARPVPSNQKTDNNKMSPLITPFK